MECIFCNIVQKNTPAQIEYQDEQVTAFKDINPKAPIHLLVVPNKHITSLAHVNDADADLLGQLILAVTKIASQKGLQGGFKTIINTGRDGGQVVDHLHIHVLGGKKHGEI